ncbi:sarcosine oxidase subunit gamma [Stagnihabitans tardus]|uniref:Sarcosine oxidase subunit gamma n=1 Tax=Stagnihabitans tardus TaxID=2699202 RepID=A0AAE4Y6W2_9RHOB|nr:sarcosine oxidase subunit gamma [Stagnihabitans tardus]NBZ86237.1 sarcosine oxidase subunit gamma [Stagnihabitans tardus]
MKPLTALGKAEPLRETIGPWELVERVDVALASVAPRRGREAEVSAAAAKAGVPVPGVARAAEGEVFASFWLTPDMFMVEAPFASHEDIRPKLLAILGDGASVTEQTDAWVRFDLTGAGLERVFQKLCNVDLGAAPEGFATRTVIEHMGCYLIKRNGVTLYGARSMAGSLHHAIHLAAGTVA